MEENDDIDENDEYVICKVVIIGEPGVGKTSIISRYVSNKFSEVLISTTGASYATKKFELDEQHKIKFQIWDTAGQERFRSLAKIFYQNAAVVMLVYDISNRSSFEQIKEYWIKEIKENAPSDIIIALVANKNDNYEFEQVTVEEGKNFAKEINAIFKSTSAKFARGINELFINIGKKFIDPAYKLEETGDNKKENKKDKSMTLKTPKKNKEKVKKKCC